jgi:hypothetical protein
MVQQPTMAAGWGVPVATTNGAAAAAALTSPVTQSMLYGTMPQFQTQWDEIYVAAYENLTKRIKRWKII